MEELVLRYTKVDDIILDPMAGGGTIVDVCKKWGRRYKCYDISPLPGRENDITEWDITKGLPDDLTEKVNLVFLDPPYWKQARGKYGEDPNNLANMSLEDFNKTIDELIENLSSRMESQGYIAFVISMTIDMETGEKVDHAHEVYKMLEKRFKFVDRITLPYPRDVYKNGAVNKAKEKRFLLPLNRELMIFQKVEKEVIM